MRLYIKILASLMLILTSDKLFSQVSKAVKTMNYVVITKDIEQIKPIAHATKVLSEEDGQKFGELQIVICGKTVTDLVSEGRSRSLIDMADKAGAKLVACGFSLDKFGVSREVIPKEINIVENGLLHNFQLQKRGYRSVEL